MEAIKKEDEMQRWDYFPSAVYSIKKPEFLDIVQEVSEEYIVKQELELATKPQDPLEHEIYPVTMTANYYGEERLAEFTQYVAQTAWNILNAQGYAMDNLNTFFMEMWTQKHGKHSLMEQHIHGYGSQISGFYFLETPENCSKLMIHDPRAGKVQANLFERDANQVTDGCSIINFTPEPGMLMFTNSWLPHSFGRHASKDPIKFVHFNIGVREVPACPITEAEVI